MPRQPLSHRIDRHDPARAEDGFRGTREGVGTRDTPFGTRVIDRGGGRESLGVRRAKLVVIEGPDSGREAPIGLVPVVVGTDVGCDLVLGDDTVSARHAELVPGPHGYLLRDRESRNGTFVAGLRLGEAHLVGTTDITLGKSRLRLVLDEGEDELPLSRATSFGGLLGHSKAMRAAFATLEAAAKSEATVLVLGESGTGKELAARAVHERSGRRDGPYVVFDCAAATPTLIESQLFGHARGAYTGAIDSRAGVFEEAHQGTLVLDEIGELPLELQPKLLRALESRTVQRVGESKRREVDVRFVACTNRNLAEEVRAGRFRADLYYRLSVLAVRLPPLRERLEEIPRLAQHFARRIAGDDAPLVPKELLAVLARHDWPGNVRELRNVVERFVALRPLDATTLLEAPLATATATSAPSDPSNELLELPFHDAKARLLEAFERSYLERLLATHGDNLSEAARVSGLSRQSCYRLLHKHGLRDDEG
ncbi:MAG: sigma 54-interacting transcriptional regulator [Polyangiales bacterium]